MTSRTDFDRALASWLTSERPPAAPDGLVDDALDEVASTARRPGWMVLDHWVWTASVRRLAGAGRVLAVAAVIALLILALVAALFLAGSRQPAPPFGLARPGLIAVDTAEGLVVAQGDGSDRQVLIPAGGQIVSPTWSRDGLWLAFWHRTETTDRWDLEVVAEDGSQRVRLAEGISLRSRESTLNQPSNISWSPDSRRLAFAGDTDGGSAIFVVDRDVPGPARIVDPALRAIDPAWAPDGRTIAFQSAADQALHVVAPDGSDSRRLGWLDGTMLWPEWSPDGRALVLTAFQNDNVDIFTVSADGSVVTNVSNDPSDEFSPSWSPDGERIAWGRATGEGTRAHIVVANADGSGQVVLPDVADLAPPVWSPDGSRVYSYVVGENDEFQDLIVLDPSGAEPAVRIKIEGNVGNGNWQRLP
jgi:Tol biopolymer transport system component